MSAHKKTSLVPAARQRGAHDAAASPGEVRIIGGQWRRTRLAVAALRKHPGLRPTPDRVRETLFNWLGQDLSGWRCVDAFAGTGALGLEAASRNAAQVWMIEQNSALVAEIEQHVQRLQAHMVRVQRGDALHTLQSLAPHSVDLIFLDPPFDAADIFSPALSASVQACAPNGFVYLEAPKAWEEDRLASLGLTLHRYLHAGQVHAHLLRIA